MKTKKQKIIRGEILGGVLVFAIIALVVVAIVPNLLPLSSKEKEIGYFALSFLFGIFLLDILSITFVEEKIISREPKEGELIKILHIEEINEPTEFGSERKFLILYLLDETVFLTYRKPEVSEKAFAGEIEKGKMYEIENGEWIEIKTAS